MKKSNEEIYLENLMNGQSIIRESQEYIEENYNVKSEYNSEDSCLHIWSDYNRSEDMILAKKYLSEKLNTNFVNIVYGR